VTDAAEATEHAPKTRNVLEIVATLLLALAAVATAWAAYQSSRWHSEQAEAQSASIAARVESARSGDRANEQQEIDVALFTQWVDAYANDETELARFYRPPGMFHCFGGYGPDRFDLLLPLADWVEQGKAPDAIPATQVANPALAQTERARPLCPYPTIARYKGSGDPDSADSYTCVMPD